MKTDEIVILGLAGLVAAKWLKSEQKKAIGDYIKIDLPPIKVPKSRGISKEGVLHQFIPKVEPVYVPPGIKLVWPAKLSIGPYLEIEMPVEARVVKLPIRYDKRAVDAVRFAVQQKLYQTKISSTDGYWQIDFPEIVIPVKQRTQ